MAQGGNMVYLGLCVRYEPPIIGIHYKNKDTDEKKKVYTIVLQRLILNPNPMEAARQLYLEHPHILKQNKIPIQKIARLIQKIQKQLNITGQDYDDEYNDEEYEQEDQNQEQQQEPQREVEQKKAPAQVPKEVPKPKQFKLSKFQDNQFDNDGPLNRSM